MSDCITSLLGFGLGLGLGNLACFRLSWRLLTAVRNSLPLPVRPLVVLGLAPLSHFQHSPGQE